MIFIVDYVKEKPEGPTAKRRRTGMGETSNSQTNVNVSENEETAMVLSFAQPPEDKESEALATPVLNKQVPSSCTNFALNSAETPSTSLNDTEGNNLLFYYYTCTFVFSIINPNIFRSIS